MTAVIPATVRDWFVAVGTRLWQPCRGVLGALYTDVELIDGEALPVELSAGSVLWFHRDLVHGSQSNHSDRNRRVFVTAYQPAGLYRGRLDKRRPIRGS